MEVALESQALAPPLVGVTAPIRNVAYPSPEIERVRVHVGAVGGPGVEPEARVAVREEALRTAAARVEAGLQVMRAPLLRDLHSEPVAVGALVPVAAARPQVEQSRILGPLIDMRGSSIGMLPAANTACRTWSSARSPPTRRCRRRLVVLRGIDEVVVFAAEVEHGVGRRRLGHVARDTNWRRAGCRGPTGSNPSRSDSWR